jgi:iron(III) transport system substrate-binding protein
MYDTPGTMLERIGSGEHLLGYDVPGSYAVLRARKDPTIGVVYPQDYTELVSYVLLIPAKAKHPNAAKLFLDFVLSREGQKTLAEGGLFAVRSDVEGEVTVKALQEKLGDRLKPIPLDDGTAQSFDDARRADFLKKWQAAIGKH